MKSHWLPNEAAHRDEFASTLRRWVDVLVNTGIEAAHWASIGAYNALDSEIMAYAKANDYIVLTHDIRDRDERQAVINHQLQEHQRLQEHVTEMRDKYHQDMLVLRKEIRHDHEVGEQALRHVQSEDHVHRHAHDMGLRL
ncbi:DUF5615 family PIN-like protein [Nitrosomonas aestuarii]|uniref:DUF5615 family PIN-like protein n=1 Tax=Nitrosomonas aestuarii TaxID=52441 RepID=UPI000B80DEFC|nr:DUF5615 family PIN-like protein [Nitrosomonas aestuarii]